MFMCTVHFLHLFLCVYCGLNKVSQLRCLKLTTPVLVAMSDPEGGRVSCRGEDRVNVIGGDIETLESCCRV